MPGHDIIVIGASAGGVEALVKVVSSLPRALPASLFVVLHLPAESSSSLPTILSRTGHLPAVHPEDCSPIVPGTIYVALPDYHLVVERDMVRLTRGPRENRHRPAIDPLFRSAALAYGSRVIGVILTGALDDGTAGLLAIKRHGGITLVQDPHEALFTGMPRSALAHVQVDYVLPLVDIGQQLTQLANTSVAEKGVPPMQDDDMAKEVAIVENKSNPNTASSNERVGNPSAFSCPECGGVLWEVHDGELLRFRCRVGHAYSVDSVIAAQSEEAERALWIALKIIEEQAAMSRRLAGRARERGHDLLARDFEAKVHDAEQRAMALQQILWKDRPQNPLEHSRERA